MHREPEQKVSCAYCSEHRLALRSTEVRKARFEVRAAQAGANFARTSMLSQNNRRSLANGFFLSSLMRSYRTPSLMTPSPFSACQWQHFAQKAFVQASLGWRRTLSLLIGSLIDRVQIGDDLSSLGWLNIDKGGIWELTSCIRVMSPLRFMSEGNHERRLWEVPDF